MSAEMVWHIFRKDTRHLRLEIAMSLALTVVFALVEPLSWRSQGGNLGNIASLLLLAQSWALLLVRVVQSERLAGTNQWWVTRPYEWTELLAAKALFAAVYIYVPLVLMQVYLLWRGGLPLGENLGPMAVNLFYLTAVMILPFAALAVLSGTVGSAVLMVMGGIAFVVALGAIGSLGERLYPPTLGVWEHVLEAVVLAGVVLLLYRSRWRLKWAWTAMAGLALTLVALQVTVPGTELAVRRFPVVQAEAPATIVPVKGELNLPNGVSRDTSMDVTLAVPVEVRGQTGGEMYVVNTLRMKLVGADGYSWQSDWIGSLALIGERPDDKQIVRAGIRVPRRVYERMKGGAATAQVELGMSEMERRPAMETVLSEGWQPVPGMGSCSLDEDANHLFCHAGLSGRSYYGLETQRTLGPCGDPGTKQVPASGGVMWTGEVFFLATHISPVQLLPVMMAAPPVGRRDANLCEGTPMQVVERRLVQRFRVETEPIGVQLKLGAPPVGFEGGGL